MSSLRVHSPLSPSSMLRVTAIFTLGCLCAAAQTGVTIAAVGYQDPQWLIVAPGQVVTIFFSGATIVLPRTGALDAVIGATELPLPTTLAGFAVGLSQLCDNLMPLPGFSSGPLLLPIFSVEQANHCIGPTQAADCTLTAITVEVLPGLQVPSGLTPFSPTTTLTIMQDGMANNEFAVSVLPVNPHVLTLCDSSYMGRPGIEANNSACPSIVTHADGTLVDPSNPAQVGEALVLYAFGLGPTVPPVPAGMPAPVSLVSTKVPYTLLFAYRSAGLSSTSADLSAPLFAGLTPGQVGLYQINFTVPMPSSAISDCSSPDGANLIVTLFNSIGYPLANLSIKGSDSAHICVATATK